VTYAEAMDGAPCLGWIDGRRGRDVAVEMLARGEKLHG
jgi:hypothetical protein